jgi:hypothetical protein
MNNKLAFALFLILALALFYFGYTMNIPDPQSKPFLSHEKNVATIEAGTNSVKKYTFYAISLASLLASAICGIKALKERH